MSWQRLRFDSWSLGRRLALIIALALVLASFGGAVLFDATVKPRVKSYEYNLAAWELYNFPSKWLYEAGSLFRSGRSVDQQNADILRFFDLTRQIDALERNGDDGMLAELRSERDRLENRVEATIESRISAIADENGLNRSFLFLRDVVWPPVDFELTDSPQTLAISPRDHILLTGSILLSTDLDLEAVEQLEDRIAGQRDVSTRAIATSGIGAYPTIVAYTDSYQRLLEVAAHEWMHNYLFFRPLGFNYYDSDDLRTMNETVADLVGREIADLVIERWPLPEPDTTPTTPTTPADQPQVNTGAVLRELRGRVDDLLATGKIDEAESLMDQTRQQLEDEGVYIRKVNQAYFAFVNLYAGEAGNPAATNPIGPKIDELRRRSTSLGQFVAIVGDVTSVRQLDQALAGLGDN